MEVKQFNPRSLLPFAGAIIVYFVFLKMNGTILNYPKWFSVSAYLAAGAIVVSCNLRKIKDAYARDGFQLALRFFQLALVTYVYAGIAVITFNLLNIQQAHNNAMQTYACPIIRFTRYETGNTIFYELNGESYHVFGKVAALDSINSNDQLSRYSMALSGHNGWLNSLVLDHWEVKSK